VTSIVVERAFPAAVSAAELREMARAGANCLALYRVSYFGSLLGADGRRATCFYAAPDAESVRIANRQNGIPFERAWPADIHGPAEGDPLSGAAAAVGGLCVAVDRVFAAPIAFDDVQAREDRHAWCLQAYRVRFLRSYLAADRRRMLCVYAAPDAEAVRHVQVTAGLPFERVWSAEICRPEA
jgi:hypothetical protein